MVTMFLLIALLLGMVGCSDDADLPPPSDSTDMVWVATGAPFGKLVATSDGTVYIGASGGIFKLENGGNAQLLGKQEFSTWLLATSDNVLYVLTQENSILRWLANDGIWQLVADELPESSILTFGTMLSFAVVDQTLFVGTETHGAFRFDGNEGTWALLGLEYLDPQIHILTVCGTTLFAVGGDEESTFSRSRDNGDSWVNVPLSMSDEFLRINSLTCDDGKLYAGTTRGVFCSEDDGDSWEALGLPDLSIDAVAIAESMVLATSEEGVFCLRKGDSAWVPCNQGLLSGSQRLHRGAWSLVASDSAAYASTGAGLYRMAIVK